jgi:hypothetical protein
MGDQAINSMTDEEKHRTQRERRRSLFERRKSMLEKRELKEDEQVMCVCVCV